MVPRGLGNVLPSRGVLLARGKVQYTYSQGRGFITQQSTSTMEYFCPSLHDQLPVSSEIQSMYRRALVQSHSSIHRYTTGSGPPQVVESTDSESRRGRCVYAWLVARVEHKTTGSLGTSRA